MGIKSFSIHKIIQNHLNKPDLLKDNIPSSIRKMGILLDHQDLNIFNPKEFFKNELGLTPENIKIFIYFDKIDPRENLLIDAFSSKDFAKASFASSLILCAPAFFMILPTGAIGNSAILSPPNLARTL